MSNLRVMTKRPSTNWRAAIGEGLYPVSFAAKITETTNARVASWFRARNGSSLAPAIMTPYAPLAGQLVMPFLALVEARFVAHFRKHGLSLQTIRKVARKLREAYEIDHPLATEGRFRTDGKRVMMEMASDNGERSIIDIMTDEFGFPNVIEPSLFDTVVYSEDLATRMTFPEFPDIVVDPNFALGRPIVLPGHVPTEALASAFLAEGDVDAVADWFGLEPKAVTQSVAFEQRLAA